MLFWVSVHLQAPHPRELIHLLCPVVQNVVQIYLTSAFYVSHYAKYLACRISIHRSIITTILLLGRAGLCPGPSAGRRWGWKLAPGLPAAKLNTLPVWFVLSQALYYLCPWGLMITVGDEFVILPGSKC